MIRDYMDRRTTDAMKGIVLIFMFIHHFFTIPESYVSGISYPELEKFAIYFFMPLKICAPVFAFLTGFFYYYGKEKTIWYSIRKITDLLIPYWLVYLILLFLAIILKCNKNSIVDVGLELLALRRHVMCFCWYVFFYNISMLLLPFLTRFPGRNLLIDAFLLLIVPAVVFILVPAFLDVPLVHTVSEQVYLWFPSIAMGFLFAKYDVFGKIDLYLNTFHSKGIKFITLIGIVMFAFFGCLICSRITLGTIDVRGSKYELFFSLEMLYGAMFVYGAAKLLQIIKKTWFVGILCAIGKKSMLMWFLHCVFFNVCKEKTQKILYFPKNPVLVVLWGLLICYGVAALIDPIAKVILKKKNSLMDRKRMVERT